MPEATVLYSVTAMVIVALIVWVAVVLKTAKEPWGRAAPVRVISADVELEPALSMPLELPAANHGSPRIDADETAKATPVALGEGRTSVTSEAADSAKSDVPGAKA
jgi:hypothetical protein